MHGSFLSDVHFAWLLFKPFLLKLILFITYVQVGVIQPDPKQFFDFGIAIQRIIPGNKVQRKMWIGRALARDWEILTRQQCLHTTMAHEKPERST